MQNYPHAKSEAFFCPENVDVFFCIVLFSLSIWYVVDRGGPSPFHTLQTVDVFCKLVCFSHDCMFRG